MRDEQPSLRERTREAVRTDITRTAVQLFLEHGYEATTIDEIAKTVGMSQRSVFRYFTTKEDIVVGKLATGAEQMLDALRARPADEPAWLSLRRMFDTVDTSTSPEVDAVQQMIFATPALLSVYLLTLHSTQARAADLIIQRAAAAGRPYEPDNPEPRALAAAAFGCLIAAQETLLALNKKVSDVEEFLDRAMGALAPLDQ